MLVLKELSSFLEEKLEVKTVLLTKDHKLVSLQKKDGLISTIERNYQYTLYLVDLSQDHEIPLQIYLMDFFKNYPRCSFSLSLEEQNEGNEEDFLARVEGLMQESLTLLAYAERPKGREMEESILYDDVFYSYSLLSIEEGI